MNRVTVLSSVSLSFVLSACGGTADGGATTNDTEDLRGVTGSVTVVATQAPTKPPPRPRVPTVLTNVVATTPFLGGPPDADLRPDGAMRYYGPAEAQTPGAAPTLGLQIDVVNVGTTPATQPANAIPGHVNIEGTVFEAVLYQYYGGTAATPNTVNPGERGYLQAYVPPSFLLPCLQYQVTIDVDRTIQEGTDVDVFANDTRTVLPYETGFACRMTWSTPINGATLGQEPDAHEAGKSLQDIVSSIEIARVDGNRCSSCHNSGANPASNFIPAPYRPNVVAGVASSPIDPFNAISENQGWGAGSDPWAEQFIAVPGAVSYSKPQYLKDAFQKWLNDGAAQ